MYRNIYVIFLYIMIVSHEVCGYVDVTTVQKYRSQVETNNVYQVSLHTSYDDEFICGGTIINATQILTVAHRLFYTWGGVLPPIIISVRGGRKNLVENASFSFGAKNVTFHPSFNKGTLEYDLAVIEIDGQFPSNVWNRISITEKLIDEIISYEVCYVTGWNEETYDLMELQVVIRECSYTFYKENICVEKKVENDSLCMISAGSSLMCGNTLIGVLTKQANCNETNQMAVFQNTKYARDLISSSVSVHFEISKSYTLWSILSALLSVFFSLLFQY